MSIGCYSLDKLPMFHEVPNSRFCDQLPILESMVYVDCLFHPIMFEGLLVNLLSLSFFVYMQSLRLMELPVNELLCLVYH